MHRREIIQMLGAGCTIGTVLSPAAAPAAKSDMTSKKGTKVKAPHILWRNAWNTNNIGDIGHVPGALALCAATSPRPGSRCGRTRIW